MSTQQLPADVEFYADVWEPPEAAQLLDELLADVDWQQHELRIFGREVLAPRLSAWYGDDDAIYSYSGLQLQPLAWTAPLQRIRSTVESLAQTSFNSVLLNQYRDGSDSMGWHSDDEPELGKRPIIASVSLGETRAFRMQHKRDKSTRRLLLTDGSVLVMRGETQREWRHSVPKTRTPCGVRINLTFRQIVRGIRP